MGTQKNRLDETVFEHPKHMLKLMVKENIYNFTLKNFVYLNLWAKAQASLCAWAFIAQQFDKHQNLMCWLIY